MPFDPSGLPTPPVCESDIARWAADLQSWLVSKLTVAHNEIDAVVVDPFDIRAELGNLSGPSCLIPATGIDTSGFSFAEDGDPITPGILPWPGSVLEDMSVISDYRVGRWGGRADHDWAAYTVTFSPAFPHNRYAIVVEPDILNKFFFYIGAKSTGSFNIQIATPLVGEEDDVSIHYTLLLLP